MREKDELVEEMLRNRVIKSQNVYKTMSAVDRADFCKFPKFRTSVYIGYNACLPSPEINALTLALLEDRVTKKCDILDVGSGSGYLATALAYIQDEVNVLGIQHLSELNQIAIRNIRKNHSHLLLERRIQIVTADVRNFHLWNKDSRKFKIINVGAYCRPNDTFLQKLSQLLEVGGRMLVPIGDEQSQKWCLIDRISQIETKQQKIMSVCFQPLTSRSIQLMN